MEYITNFCGPDIFLLEVYSPVSDIPVEPRISIWTIGTWAISSKPDT